MDTFVEIFQGLPVVILISLIFGVTALIRMYIMTNPSLRRLSTQDRRQSQMSPMFPFQDNKNNVITENRRKLYNRRLASHVKVNYCVLH